MASSSAGDGGGNPTGNDNLDDENPEENADDANDDAGNDDAENADSDIEEVPMPKGEVPSKNKGNYVVGKQVSRRHHTCKAFSISYTTFL